jgi:hypothetical protein
MVKRNIVKDKENVHFLKFLNIIYLTVFNDLYSAAQIEKNIQEIILRDQTKDQAFINAINIISGNVASIVISFSDQVCKIEGYSSVTPKFFGFSKREFDELKNPNIILPTMLQVYHDSMVSRLIRDGDPHILRRYRTLVAQEKEGYIFPIKIYVDYFCNLNN